VKRKISNIFEACTPISTFSPTNQCNTPKIVWFDDGSYVYLKLFDFDPFSFENFSNVAAPLELHDYDLLSEFVGLFKVQASTNNVVD